MVAIDVRGEICPVPMMKAVDAMESAGEGETVEVLTDHPPALLTIPNQALQKGWDVSIKNVGSAEWKVVLTRSEAEE